MTQDRITAEEYQYYTKYGHLRGEKPKRSKYRNQRQDGYDSKHEANRAAELALMVKAGEARAVAEQVPFELAGGIKYVADFVVMLPDGTYRVEDAKGYKTPEYRLKRKLMRAIGIEIMEV